MPGAKAMLVRATSLAQIVGVIPHLLASQLRAGICSSQGPRPLEAQKSRMEANDRDEISWRTEAFGKHPIAKVKAHN